MWTSFVEPVRPHKVGSDDITVGEPNELIRPDVAVFINGIPLAIAEAKSPTLGEGWKQEAIDQFSRYQELEAKYRELIHSDRLGTPTARVSVPTWCQRSR